MEEKNTVNYSAGRRTKSALLARLNRGNKKHLTKQKPRILILVEDGQIQGVSTTVKCEVVIYDYDYSKIGEDHTPNIEPQDSLFKPGKAHTVICALNKRERAAKDRLKQIKF